MPLIHESQDTPEQVEADDIAQMVPEAEGRLLKDGKPTLEGEVLADFLQDVDWSDLFEDEAIQEHITETILVGAWVEDEETGEVFFEEYGPASEDMTDEEAAAIIDTLEAKHYGKRKGKMKPKDNPGHDDAEDDEPVAAVKEGESTGTPPQSGSLTAATKHGLAGMMSGKVRIGLGNGGGTGPTHVGKGDKKHKAGVRPMAPGTHMESITDEQASMLASYEDLDVLVIQTIPGEIVAQHVDEADLMAMLPYYIDALPEDTLEDRAKKALFNDVMEVDRALTYGLDPDTDPETVDEVASLLDEKKPFPRGGFKKKFFKGAKQGSQAHSQRMRMMLAMLHKSAIHRAGAGKGYRKGGYKYQGPKSGLKADKKAYAKYKKSKIGKIKQLIKSKKGPGLKVQKRIIVKQIHPHLGTKPAKPWIAPQDRPDLGLGSLFPGKPGKAKKAKAVKKTPKMKAKTKGGKKGKRQKVKADAPQTPANITETVESVPTAETPGYRLVRAYSGSGPRLAGLISENISGARAEHQEAIAAEQAAEKAKQLND